MLSPTLHFKPEEFACKDGTAYPEDWEDRWSALSALCEAVRALWNGPLGVVSGYRTAAYNASLLAEGHHPASQSYHIQGMAADLEPIPSAPMAVERLWMTVKEAYHLGELPTLGGLGVYPGWIHIDLGKAPDGHLRQWDLR
jgi:uncharacterized protein YcbK (DUF882 family)